MNMDVAAINYSNAMGSTKKDVKKNGDRSVSAARAHENSGKAHKAGASESTGSVVRTGESKLSAKAQEFLKDLRKKYGDYDFFVGDSGEDLKSLAKSGTKEFSVIFSSEELERMANDEAYAQEKLQGMERAVAMSKEINARFGFKSASDGDGDTITEITRIGITFNEDGTTSLFAELEKSSAKQREYMDKAAEERRAGKQEDEKRPGGRFNRYSGEHADVWRTTVEADSMEELLDKISNLDWNAVDAERVSESGGRYDFSI